MQAFQTIMSLIGSFSGIIIMAIFALIMLLGVSSLRAKTILIANRLKSKVNEKSQSFYQMVARRQNNDELVPIPVESDCDNHVNYDPSYNYYYKNSAPAAQDRSDNFMRFSSNSARGSEKPRAGYLEINSYPLGKSAQIQLAQTRKEGVYACEKLKACHASTLRA